jgi:iron(III) transport system ATP-binding protein
LLRAIAGLDIQSTGRISQAGKDISTLPPAERDFGIVFQSYALFPNMSVTKNVAYGLESQRAPRASIGPRVRELLELVGLPEQGDKYPSQLSGGEQQRVALARAIATSPGLLLLDEPLSALDAKVRTRLRHEVKELQRRLGVTTIMVTHDQEEALTMADRIVVMEQGRIEQVGTPEQIYGEPATAFVADFVGTMNFLPATTTADGINLGGIALTCEHGMSGPDQPVTVAIRPEDLVFDAAEEADGNLWPVRVVELEFLGSFVRATLAFGAAQHTMNLLADVSINLVRHTNLAQGQEHRVALPADRIRVYPGHNVRE